MTVIQGILLSLVQAATEFLPVSSSGHLVLAQALWPERLSPADNVAFVVLVHVATLVSVCAVFRKRLGDLIAFCFSGVWDLSHPKQTTARWLSDPRGRLILAVVIGTLPTGVIGLVGKNFFENLFSRPENVGYALCFTAFLLVLTFSRGRRESPPSGGSDRIGSFPLWMAFVIGIVQGIAITPGVSRSGSTIAVAILIGMNRREAGEFSFLLSIPAILAALALELKDFDPATSALPTATGIASFVVAGVAGYVFLRLLLRFVRGGQFGWFSVYCLAVGVWAILKF